MTTIAICMADESTDRQPDVGPCSPMRIKPHSSARKWLEEGAETVLGRLLSIFCRLVTIQTGAEWS
jgi:hypothetical protein